ncbi:MAG: hypothetical protein JO061_08990 [Acidobacteriaceae bacterium]|nr:hypothetical protein [Acidobacteriaceae bacterium]
MPNKTIYVKDSDLPLLEQAQQELGDSVSAMFAEFLRARAATLTPEENKVISLVNRITEGREHLKRDHSLPGFLDGEYAEAERYAEKCLKSMRSGDIRRAKVLYWAANTFIDRAERDVKETSELVEKIGGLLGNEKKQRPRRP